MRFQNFSPLFVPLLVFSRSFKAFAAILEAEIDAGTVRGSLCNGSNSSSQFLGIPYAIPPVGELRWEAPLAYNATFEGGTLNATRLRPICHQFGDGTASDPGPYSEDCLHLNIWVPENASQEEPELPVKVWVHGGGNIGGTINNPLYNGCRLAEEGAIVVNIAYRLGPLGFLALESAGIAGNFAIQDILLGLQWVQDNIAQFGGDKDKVLLFGQSAGAWNSWIISTLPSAPSLMRAVAVASGGGIDFQTNSSAQLGGAAFARNANCSTTDSACLRRLTPEQLNEITFLPGSPPLAGFTIIRPLMQPFIDGRIISNQPSQVGSRVPAVFSSTVDEGTFFALLAAPDPTNFDANVLTLYLQNEFGPLADEIDAEYPPSDFEEFTLPAFARAAQVITDYAWKCPAYRGLTSTAERGVPAWTYIFDHVSTCPFLPGIDPLYLEVMGSVHGADVPYIFGQTDGLPRPDSNCSLNDEEKRISEILVNAGQSLATSGNASTNEFEWPNFTNESYMGLYVGQGQNSAEIISLASDYSICGFWNQINALMLEAANTNNTNVTEEIPPSPTITDIPAILPNATETDGPIPTEGEPSRALQKDIKIFSILIAVVVECLVIASL